jgi:hypothetical protein
MSEKMSRHQIAKRGSVRIHSFGPDGRKIEDTYHDNWEVNLVNGCLLEIRDSGDPRRRRFHPLRLVSLVRCDPSEEKGGN